LWVPWYGGAVRCTVWFGYANGRKCFFIEPHSAANFFGRDHLYGYGDDAERFAFFSKAAVEFMLRADKRPDVIHCHDWQTGLVPVLLYEQYGEVMPGQKVCYTIHNFRHQGTSDEQVLWATQLGRPDYFLDADRLGDDFRYRGLNLMKGGVAYADFVTTVSPSHADEALYGDGGSGPGRTLKEHQDKFRGVLNGVDYDAWNPETDPIPPVRYSAGAIERKSENKEALRDRFWLRKTRSPVVAYVGRLDEQKGMHLVHHALFTLWPAAVSSCSSVTPTITTASIAISGISRITSTTTRIVTSNSVIARNWPILSTRARTCWSCPACSSRADWLR
jgi:starch synthase